MLTDWGSQVPRLFHLSLNKSLKKCAVWNTVFSNTLICCIHQEIELKPRDIILVGDNWPEDVLDLINGKLFS